MRVKRAYWTTTVSPENPGRVCDDGAWTARHGGARASGCGHRSLLEFEVFFKLSTGFLKSHSSTAPQVRCLDVWPT